MAERQSWPARLADLEVGETAWFETTAKRYKVDVHKAVPHSSRLRPHLRGRRFQTRLYTAVSASDCADVRYLIEVKRTV